jgi:hypothetical protein
MWQASRTEFCGVDTMTTSTAKSESQSPNTQPAKRSLWKRLLLRLVMVLLLAAIGGAGYLYYRSNRLIKSEPYQAALKYVMASNILKEKVGEPLTSAGFIEDLRNGSNVTEEGNSGEAQIQFKMTSPKGLIKVSSAGRKRDGTWAINDLAVEIPGEKDKVSLNAEVEVDTAKETPKFDPNKTPEKIITPVLPSTSGDIKIEIPDLPAVPQK